MDDSHYEALLAKQLIMNQQTWAALQKHSVNEDTELRLDFSYNAPIRESAEILRAFLVQETDYEVRVASDGSFLRKNWRSVSSSPHAEEA